MKHYFYVADTDNDIKDVIVTTEKRDGQEPLLEFDTDNKALLCAHRKRLYYKVNWITPEVKKLPDAFDGFRKVEEGERHYIYENIRMRTFEVFEKRVRRGRERYPEDEDFGVWAWCFHDIGLARKCAGRLP